MKKQSNNEAQWVTEMYAEANKDCTPKRLDEIISNKERFMNLLSDLMTLRAGTNTVTFRAIGVGDSEREALDSTIALVAALRKTHLSTLPNPNHE